MHFGFAPLNQATSLRPDLLGRELEARGFESVWMPEHSHIPVERQSAFVGGGELPASYYGMLNPFVSLAAMLSSTTSLVLGTGVCQVLEHDLIDLAKTVASLDVLSGHRVVLGVGAGWNREELTNHRADIPFGKRYEAIEERLQALRQIWREDVPEFRGQWDSFSPSRIDPKPAHGTVPIALGMTGPKGLELAARFADQWIPVDAFLRDEEGRHDIDFCLARFRASVERAGRDPDGVRVTMFYSGPATERRLERYLRAGLGGLVFLPTDHDVVDSPDALEARLDELAPFIDEYGSRPVPAISV